MKPNALIANALGRAEFKKHYVGRGRLVLVQMLVEQLWASIYEQGH